MSVNLALRHVMNESTQGNERFRVETAGKVQLCSRLRHDVSTFCSSPNCATSALVSHCSVTSRELAPYVKRWARRHECHGLTWQRVLVDRDMCRTTMREIEGTSSAACRNSGGWRLIDDPLSLACVCDRASPLYSGGAVVPSTVLRTEFGHPRALCSLQHLPQRSIEVDIFDWRGLPLRAWISFAAASRDERIAGKG